MLEGLDNVIGSLTKENLQNYFSDWSSRMHKCIDAASEYFDKIN